MKLTLKQIVNVSVNLASRSAARKGFNVALIIGKSQVIPQKERVRVYTSADAMLTDGFLPTSAEYKAALLYFSATKAPTKLVVGAKYDTDEDMLATVRACREANSEWYVAIPLGIDDADILKIAEWAESAQPDTLFAYTTAKTVNLSSHENGQGLDAGDDTKGIFLRLKEKNYRRSFGQYCAQEDTPDAVVATMGYAMGANRGTNGSAYTLAYKKLPGITPDDLTEAQVQWVVGDSETTGTNGNVYVRRAETYDVLQQGTMADGTHFDEILNLDMLKNEIVLSVMDLLTSVNKVPGTEAGVASIVNRINRACDKFVNSGFIAPGVWNGGTVLTLEDGMTLPNGYIVLSEAVADQSQADRDMRKSPPIYVCIKTAGAIEFVTVEVNVNR